MTETAALRVKYTGDSGGLVSETKQAERALDRYGKEIDQSNRKSAKFTKHSKSASAALSSFRKGFGSTAKAATLFGTALATGATIAMARFVSQGLKSVDVLAKQASELSVATETLAAYNRAAVATGVDIKSVTTAMQKLSRSLLDAEQGSKTAAGALAGLNLKSSELIKLAPDLAFEKVADAISNVESPTLKTALAMQLLGRSGAGLINFLRVGTSGMAQFRQETQIAGTALTKEMAASVEQANDAMSLLGELSTGLGQQLAVKFAPVLTAVSNMFFETAKNAGGMGNVATSAFDSMVNGAAFVVNAIDGFVRVTKLAVIGFKFLGTGFLKALSFMLNVLQNTPPGLAVRTFMAAFGFFKGEGFNLPDYKDSAMASVLKSFEADLTSLAAESEALLTEPLNGEKLKIFVNDAIDEYGRVTFAVEDYTGALLDTEGVLKRIGDVASNSAKEAERAWASAANQIGGAFSQILQLAGVNFGGGGGFLGALGGVGGGISLLGALGTVSGGGGATAGGGLLGAGVGGALGFGSGVFGAGGLLSGTGAIGNAGTSLFGFGSGADLFLQDVLGALNPATLIGSLGAGFLGNAILGDKAGLGSGLGGLAGGVAGLGGGLGLGALGAFGGPVGVLIGTLLGGLVESLFSSGKKRSNTGFLAGVPVGGFPSLTGNREGSIVTGASGLRLQTFTRRGSAGQSQELLDTALQLDAALAALTRAAGIDLDLSNASFSGQGIDQPTGGRALGGGPFFGATGFDGGGSVVGTADKFVVAWLREVNDQLPKRVRQIISGVDQVAAELVAAFEAALSIDKLLDLDVVKRTEEALKKLTSGNFTLFESYQDVTQQTLDLAGGLNATASALTVLNDTLIEQKTIAVQLAAAFQTVGIEVDALLGATIQSIRESLLTDEELYNSRRGAIASLTAELEAALSPETIGTLVREIDRLTNQQFGALDTGQQASTQQGFIDFLTHVDEIAQRQINTGLSDLGTSESDLQQAIDLQIAQSANSFETAANTFADAVAQFLAGTGGTGFTTISTPFGNVSVPNFGEINA